MGEIESTEGWFQDGPDFYVEITFYSFVSKERITKRSGGVSDNAHIYPHWLVWYDINDQVLWPHTGITDITLSLWDDDGYYYDPFTGKKVGRREKCDISPTIGFEPWVCYNATRGYWCGDDYLGDDDGYGCLDGRSDNDDKDDNDCLLRFDIRFNDYDYVGLCPIVNDGGEFINWLKTNADNRFYAYEGMANAVDPSIQLNDFIDKFYHRDTFEKLVPEVMSPADPFYDTAVQIITDYVSGYSETLAIGIGGAAPVILYIFLAMEFMKSADNWKDLARTATAINAFSITDTNVGLDGYRSLSAHFDGIVHNIPSSTNTIERERTVISSVASGQNLEANWNALKTLYLDQF